ncbi:MAG: hypothetical protein DLM62_18915 [Pseudonocardiales bacterium]|nr:MAG: hypothetical protein DLM62_18915 [Pseudonocardiales bacterium]
MSTQRSEVTRRRRLVIARLAGAVEGEAGMSTVEYAIGTIAAAAFAAVLYKVVTPYTSAPLGLNSADTT